MKIAVEGCMHGDLDNVYSTLLHLQEVENMKIDLLICCGDFQVHFLFLSVPPSIANINFLFFAYEVLMNM